LSTGFEVAASSRVKTSGGEAGTRRRQRGRVRIEDVAELAGVSAITVSRVLRTPAVVAEETRRRVDEAVDRLGYVPNLAAGTLASLKSRLVAVVVPTLRSSVYADTIQGLSDELSTAGYHLMVGYSAYSADLELSVLRAFMGRQPEAVVLTGVEHSSALRRLLRKSKVPTVEIWDLIEDPIDVAVGFDNVAAGACVADHLAKVSVRRPAVLGSDPAREARAAKRLAGFAGRCRALGLRAPAVEPLVDGMSPEEAEAGFRRLVSRAPDVDGLFCLNDALAIAALMEARRLSIDVPGRLRIAGFGDFDLAAHVTPRLTTVRVPGYEIGRRAARRLLDRAGGARRGAKVEDLSFELIVRESA
jgi:LacI family transcriptional regulator, gluconate utilization system Gnt-I transcriptional repressor